MSGCYCTSEDCACKTTGVSKATRWLIADYISPNDATPTNGGGAETVLDEAARIVDGDRNDAYGDPAGNHGTTADLWNAYLERRGIITRELIDARDVCWMNALQKASRDAFERTRDNLVDTAGYMRNAEIIGENHD